MNDLRNLVEKWRDMQASLPVQYARVAGAIRKCADELQAALDAQAGGCSWTLDSTEYHEIWETGCGQSWSFTEGGPADNNVRFCYGCGKPVHAGPVEGGDNG